MADGTFVFLPQLRRGTRPSDGGLTSALPGRTAWRLERDVMAVSAMRKWLRLQTVGPGVMLAFRSDLGML